MTIQTAPPKLPQPSPETAPADPIACRTRSKKQAQPIAQRTRSKSKCKYASRDNHELFFRPKAKGAKATSKHRTKASKRKKPPPLTDKQRRAEARAHYALHHGTTMDATSLLQNHALAKQLSAATITQLKLVSTNPFDRSSAAPPTPTQPLIWTTATGKKIPQPNAR